MTLPTDFVNEISSFMEYPLRTDFIKALQQEPRAFIRVHPQKARNYHLLGKHQRIRWCDSGYCLDERPEFTFDPLMHGGLYYVQEASSMFLSEVLRQLTTAPVSMLDMCAAPGGKSTLALNTLPGKSVVFCNEPIYKRARILSENVQKCGLPNNIVTNNYPADYTKAGLLFDIILCDVPCSGEGMFRKNPEAITQWSMEKVNSCQHLQREIVSDAWKCLQPGGFLIYSTCTFNTKENEENIRWIMNECDALPVNIAVDPKWNVCHSLLPGFDAPVYRFIPGYQSDNIHAEGEGLFMAVLRKKGKRKDIVPQKTREKDDISSPWLKDSDLFFVTRRDKQQTAIPKFMKPAWEIVGKKLRILSTGVMLGEEKGRQLIPQPGLAFSTALNKNAFPAAEIGYQDALRFLRRETIPLPESTPRGFVLLTYQQLPIGFVKNIGNRANNLYPQEWAIKSTHLPSEAPGIFEKS